MFLFFQIAKHDLPQKNFPLTDARSASLGVRYIALRQIAQVMVLPFFCASPLHLIEQNLPQ
jgi:hypothetical protein